MASTSGTLFVVQHMYNDNYHGTKGAWTPELSEAKLLTLEGARNVVKRFRKGGDKNWTVVSVSLTLNPWKSSDNNF